MVRWIDGFFAGLIAGVTSALFYAVVAVAWLHDVTLGAFFAQVAHPVALGVVLYFVLAGVFGFVYALLARRFSSMWAAPTSVLWGLVYGLLVWWVLNDVLVPLNGALVVEPLWERLVGTVIFYGVVLSELTTMAHRRAAGASP